MKRPYHLFIACFFCLTLSLANGSANATEQVNDNFVYQGKKYGVTGERIQLNFKKWGLRPTGFSTANYRGYIASFALDGDKLVLTDLITNHNVTTNDGSKAGTAPKINGVTPKKYTREERWNGFIAGDLEYKNINLPLDYTGSAYLKDGHLIGGMHGRFDDAAGYETVLELTFEKGILKSEKDISQEMAEIRERTKQIDAMRRNVESIKDLIAEGLDVNMESYNGTTPLHVAIEKENLEMVEFLISKGANVHVLRNWHNGNTLLHLAAGQDNVDIVKLLVSKGLDVNAKDKGNQTPLHTAAKNPNATIAEFLVAQGADVNAKCDYPYFIPLQRAVATNSNVKVVELLVSKMTDVNAKDEDGRTLLHYAGVNPNVAIAEFLVFKGADVRAKGKDGTTPLHCVGGNLAVAKLLVSKGADVRAKSNNGSTPLHAVSFHGNNIEVVKFFVERGADVNAKDNDGNTPLHLAVSYGSNADVVLFLLSQGADVRAKNKEGKTPLDKAHSEYTKYLSGR